MIRYIDADAFIRNLQERYCEPCKANGLDYNGVKCKSCQFDDEIDDIDGFADNSIDLEPKRGEWKDINYKDYKACCSCCGVWSPIMGNFCPNCGARMKGADDE